MPARTGAGGDARREGCAGDGVTDPVAEALDRVRAVWIAGQDGRRLRQLSERTRHVRRLHAALRELLAPAELSKIHELWMMGQVSRRVGDPLGE